MIVIQGTYLKKRYPQEIVHEHPTGEDNPVLCHWAEITGQHTQRFSIQQITKTIYESLTILPLVEII